MSIKYNLNYQIEGHRARLCGDEAESFEGLRPFNLKDFNGPARSPSIQIFGVRSYSKHFGGCATRVAAPFRPDGHARPGWAAGERDGSENRPRSPSARRTGNLEGSTRACRAGWPTLDLVGSRCWPIAVASRRLGPRSRTTSGHGASSGRLKVTKWYHSTRAEGFGVRQGIPPELVR